MSQATNYLENELIDHVFRNAAMTSPTSVFLALHTADPTETGAVAEISGNGYARQAITFGAPADGVSTNSNAPAFTASGGNFGTITHFSIHDAVSAGNALAYGALDTSRTINDGETITFNIGDVSVTMA